MEDSFVARWRVKEKEHGLEVCAAEMVACGEWWLPQEAAPCLTFEVGRPVWEVFGPRSRWSADDLARLAPYQVIGSDGAGNPICLETEAGEVWLLDHEDGFRSRQFVNSSVRQLAECLLARLGEESGARLAGRIRELDGPAIQKESFWWHEAATLDVRD